VDISEQSASAMVGNEVYYTALGTTGKDGWETPIGEFRIQYRVYNETMTSVSIGAEEYYVLDDVLFTQYFTGEGHALHLNYWRPDSVFGNQRTSHGCIGLRYRDAEFFWNFANVGTRVVIQP
jgi:lipoprotein-anchoring transpeptidase ErfK/SrfK